MHEGASGVRVQAYEMYKPYIVPMEEVFNPDAMRFTEEEREELNSISGDLSRYINDTFRRWMIDGGADAEWDAYVSQLKKLGSDQYAAIYQAA
jgi:putative aldouronate transport system substrate-binding protein